MFRDIFGASPAKPAQATTLPANPALPAKHTVSETVLGIDTCFEGSLGCKGNIRIDGTFCGPISTEGRVVITDQALIEGDIIGDSITVSGTVQGNLIARKIAILRSGRVLGDLRMEQLATEEGGFIQGLITMEVKLDVPAVIEAQRSAKKALTIEAAEEVSEPVEPAIPLDDSRELVPVDLWRKYSRD